MNQAKIAEIILPTDYQDNFRVSFTDKYAGIIGVKTNEFWFLSYKIDNFQHRC